MAIQDEVRCVDDTMRIDRDLHILAGGRLILEGCTLVVASAPYEDDWVGPTSEGLDIRIERGGRLEIRASATRASAIEPQDARYGYTIVVEGTLVSDGRRDAPTAIKGLEGFMAEAFLGGGLLVTSTGRAWLNHTSFTDIKGPAVFAHDGGMAWVRGALVRQASGAFAAVNATLHVEDADLNTGIEGIRVSSSHLTLRNVTSRTDRTALHATRGTLVADDVHLAARNTVVLADTLATLRDCTIQSIGFGLAHHAAPATSDPGLVEVQRCVFQPRPGVPSEVGMFAQHATLRVQDSRLEGAARGGISVRDASLQAERNVFTGTGETDIFAANAGLDLAGNTYSASATHPVRAVYRVEATVLGPAGEPASGVPVRLGNVTGNTDRNGTAALFWEPQVAEGTPLRATVQATLDGTTLERTVTPMERAPVFDFGADRRGAPAPAMLAALAAVAVALAAWRAGRGRGGT